MTRSLDTLGQGSLQLRRQPNPGRRGTTRPASAAPPTSGAARRHARQLPDRTARRPRGRARRRHPHRLPRQDRAARSRAGRWAGVAFAATVSIAFGALLTFGPSGLTFEAQEAIGGTLSILAVGLITWMIFWMARMARYMRAELHAKLDDAINGGAIAVFVVAILAVGPGGPRDRALPVGRRAGRADELGGPAARRHPRPRDLVRHRLGDLPRRVEAQPARVLRLDRAVPDRRRGRRPRLRRPRPPGGGHPARPQQPRLRRVGHDPAGQHPRHDCSRASSTSRPPPPGCRPSSGSPTSSRHDPVRAARLVLGAAARARRSRRRARPVATPAA